MNSDQLLAHCPGLTYRRLHLWTTNGWLNPAAKGSGPGYGWTFPDSEVRVAEIMTQLVAVGMRPEPAHRAARAALTVGDGDVPAVELAPDVYLVLGSVKWLVPA